MGHRIVILGGGGHSKVIVEIIVEIIRRLGLFEIVGYTGPGVGTLRRSSYLGSDDLLPALRRDGIAHAFIALGDNALRAERGDYAARLGFTLPSLACPSAIVSSTAQIGSGALIMSGAIVNADACIGDLAIVNTRASVDHDCIVGSAAHIAPGAVLAGNVAIGEKALVGAGAIVINSASVGPRAVIAAGSVVTRAVAREAMVGGAPAKPLRIVNRRSAVEELGRRPAAGSAA